MSEEISPATGRAYGARRVCKASGIARSSWYERQKRRGAPEPVKARPGPKPKIDDETLLALIRRDLAESPFSGEGHRKVWARLKYGRGVRAGRNRVLRVMRQNDLLSPHRGRQGPPKTHEGRIVTDRPDQMWGTDGTRVLTSEEGNVWIFAVVEHWNGECMGLHVSKRGDRFAALEPLSRGLRAHFGSTGPDAARGLSLRMDHGSQYTSEHFQNQIRAWGIAPSFAFVSEPETNGVAERFFRTMKEQVVYGRTFRNANELREAMERFVTEYNRHWLMEKNGYRSPIRTREDWTCAQAA